jgi:gamma-glutamyltranspeptidase/glutathione hydrolase
VLHNRGSYFSLDPRHVNYLQPGKRTMHTLTPAMVLRDGVPSLVVGTMGGDAQPQIHVQLLSAMLDFDMNVQQAIAAPRWRSGHIRVNPLSGRQDIMHGQRGVEGHLDRAIAEVVMLESRFPSGVPLVLDMYGHRTNVVGPWDDGMGHAQAIKINHSSQFFEGAADPRCDGLALGW